MTRHIVRLVLATLALAAVAVPARGGEYELFYDTVSGIRVDGNAVSLFNQAVTFSMEIVQLEGGSADGPVRVLPLPTVPNTDQAQPVARQVGCIEMRVAGGGMDRGCRVNTAAIEMDPVMESATLVVWWHSNRFESEQLGATFALVGDGPPTVAQEGDDPSADPPGASFDGRLLLLRNARVVAGFVISEGLGNLRANVVETDVAQMFTGIAIDFEGTADCLASVALLGGCVPS